MDRKAAEGLLEIGAVYLRPDEPFTWASGIKSPIYCDNRIVLSYPHVRSVVEDGLAALIRREYPGAEAVFGTATAGIAPLFLPVITGPMFPEDRESYGFTVSGGNLN